MLKERFELEKNLDSIITTYNANKKVADAVKKNMNKHNILTGEFQEIWFKNTPLDTIDEVTLYLLTKYLYEKTNEPSIKKEDYFTEVEIDDGNKYKKQIIDNTISYPIIFNNVLKGKDDQYILYLPIQKIKQLQDSSIITYNFETQRSPKHKLSKDGDLIKVANVNKQSVSEIADFFLEGRFIPNTITLNLLQDGNDEFGYNDKTNELVIASGQINIIDGFHRCLGIIKALGENPDLDYIMEVRFTNWDVQKCRNFIHQENIRNKINSKYIQSIININKWGNKVVNKINDGQGDLKGKITTDFTLIRMNKAFTMFDMMSNTIDMLWEIKTNMEVNNLANYLTNFFDYVIGYKVEDFIDDLKGSKSQSVVTMPAMFVGYLCVAKKLQHEEDWEKRLIDFLDNTNFDINNPEWVKIGIINKKLNPTISLTKSNLKNIISYFNEIIY
ncbi:DNA sulfur modification protein DndB [Anaerovorax odorimutans]|uniref:DNA sulfur modification protein DndB n=1 Tax=Anaerovorax odorimutans TaxID=109327 RepID=UPI0004067EA0|nr:DNA sulfur modification protein DndB [Anaerovorax odorimutans]